MRVLLINRHDYLDGGADRVFHNTFDLLSQSRDPQFVVDKFTRKDLGMEKSIDPRNLSVGDKFRMVGSYLYDKRAAEKLEEKIRQFQPDIAHVHLIYGTLTVSVLRVLKKHRIPVVMTLHDYRMLCPANAFIDRHGKVCEKCRKTKYYQCLLNKCSGGNAFYSTMTMLEAYLRKYRYQPHQLVDHFIFVSEFGKQKHEEYDQRYQACSTRIYNMNVPTGRSPVHKGDYFLYYGRLSREKGIRTLLTAAKKSGVKVVIAGTGPQELEILEVVSHENMGNQVKLTGQLTGKALSDLIAGCSFVVVPTECYDNNPMCIVESFSQGKPVIGSRIGSIPESVRPENGFLFETGNSDDLAGTIMRAMAIPPADYELMCNACHEYGEHAFGREQHLKSLVEVYNRAIAKA